MRVGGEHRQRVRRRDENALADDQIAVAVAVGCRAEIGRIRAHHLVVELLGVDQVGVGMVAAEIGQRHEVARGARRRAEPAFQDFLGIGPGHGMHGVEGHAEAAMNIARIASKSNRLSISSA